MPDDQQFQDVAASRAERHSDAYFARALRDSVSHHAVNSGRGEDQREDAEAAQKYAEHPEGHDHAVAHLSHRFDIEDRLVTVNRLNLAPDRRGQGQRLRPRARDQSHRLPCVLRQRHVKIRRYRPEQLALRVTDDADHFPQTGAKANVFAQGVAVGPEALRQSFVDDDHGIRIGGVGFGELAALDHGDAHRFEVIGRADAMSPVELLSGRRIGHAFDQKTRRRIALAQRQIVDQRGRFDSVQTPRAPHQLVVKRAAARVVFIFGGGQSNSHRQHVVSIDARIYFQNRQEVLHQQPRAGQQHQRHRDFSDGQRGAQPMTTDARLAHAVLQRFVQIGLRRLNRRREAEEDSGHYGNDQRENQHARIDAEMIVARHHPSRFLRQRDLESLDTPSGEQNADRSANERQDDAFGQQLPDDPAPGGAKRQPQRNLFHSPRRAGKRQIGDIGAGDQQHERDRGHYHQRRRFIFAHGVFEDRENSHAPPGVRVRILLFQPSGDRVQIGLRLPDRDAFFQPPDHQAKVIAAIAHRFRRHRHRRQKLGAIRIDHVRRHYADNRARDPVDVGRPAHDIRIAAEAPLPQAVSQYHDVVLTRLIFIGQEVPPQRDLYS